MSVHVIDTIKPKNNGTFPVAEDVDIAITGSNDRLSDVVAKMATQDDITDLETAIEGKASESQLEDLSAAVETKASAEDLTDLSATVSTKADKSKLAETDAAVSMKASTADLQTATNLLQAQINEIVSPVTQDAEVENARVNAIGTTFTTLKERLDNFENTVEKNNEQFGAADISLNEKKTATVQHNGITYTYDSLGKYKISGTANSNSFYNVFQFENNMFPPYVKKGSVNYIAFTTTNADITCMVYQQTVNDSDYVRIATFSKGDAGAVFIDEDAVNLIVRFFIASGKVVDEYAYCNVSFASSKTNQQLDTVSLKSTYTILPECDLNDVTGNNVYLLLDSNIYTHSPVNGGGMLFNIELAADWVLQLCFKTRENMLYKRDKSHLVAAGWSEWSQINVNALNELGSSTTQPLSQKFITDNSSSFAKDASVYTDTDPETDETTILLSDIKEPGYYVIDASWIILDAPTGSRPTGCKVEKYKAGNNESFLKQTVETISGNTNYPSFFRYTNIGGEYQEWKPVGSTGFIFSHPDVLPNQTDLNDLAGDNTWLLANAYEGQPLTYYNAPWYNASGEAIGILTCSDVCGWHFQIYYNFSNGNVYRRFGNIRTGVWREWVPINGGGSAITYNVTQNINRDNITNAYNITTTPTITTDSNGWLRPVDTETASETGKTDMTGAIMSMLNDTGYCHLAPGIYYVSGNINMPAGATLEGCGKKTVLRLLPTVSSGYTVRIGQNNTVKNICFSGGSAPPSDVTTEGTDLGSRHGIYLIANADGEESSQPATKTNIVTGCYFENYDGSAYYNHNTGGGMDNAIIMTDCRIVDCKVGINVDYYGEYSKFTSVVIRGCNHACINNGGNNIFTGCTFHGVVGFLIDNSVSDKRNNAHGTCIGCTFNHINNANAPSLLGMGDAILVKGATNGFLFNDSQIWYGKINIQNSQGISVNNALIGGRTPEISVVGDYGAFFRGCTFMAMPSISANTATKFDNCYLASTGVPIINQ